MKKSFDFKSRREWESFLWEEFLDNLANLANNKSRRELQKAIENVLSEAERKMIIKRLTTLILIKEGKSYKEISEILWLSPNTISAIKKNMLESAGGYKSRRQIELSENRKKSKLISPKYKEIRNESLGSILLSLLKHLDENWPPSAYNNPRERWKFLSRR